MMDASAKVGHHHAGDALADPNFAFPHLLHAIPDLSRVRFGMWEDILKTPQPQGSDFHIAMWHYARGMALAATKRFQEAHGELAALRKLAALPAMANMKIFDVNSLGDLAMIAVDVLAGEIDARQGKFGAAIATLRKAVAREDALLYSEPPDWPNPVRHNLGAVLLEAGKAAEAEKVFREDLGRHRNNGWGLMGLVRALEMQNKTQEAAGTRALFEKAWARADIKITSSRL
jgi:predicted Zn-dependent protease